MLPWLIDRHKAADELSALIRSDDTISDEKKSDLTDGTTLGDDSALLLFFANVILFSMSKPLQPDDFRIAFSGKAFLDNITAENEPPLPCKYFCGRDREIDELHTLLSVHHHSVSYDYTEVTKDLAQSYLIVGNIQSAISEIILSLETYRQVLDDFEFSTLTCRYIEIFHRILALVFGVTVRHRIPRDSALDVVMLSKADITSSKVLLLGFLVMVHLLKLVQKLLHSGILL